MSTDETDTSWDALLPAPPVTPPRLDEVARLDTRVRVGLSAEILREQRVAARRTRVQGALPAAAVLGSAAAVLALVLVAAGSPRPAPLEEARPVVASADAVVALARAARNVDVDADVPEPTSDQFTYVRSVAVDNEGAFGGPVELGDRHPRALWLSQATGSTEIDGLIREHGQDWPMGEVPTPPGLLRPTYAWLASLPTDPGELLAELDSQIPVYDDARSRDQVVFDEMVGLMGEMVAPPRTIATFYEALTRIPGVGVDESARDPLGRAGVGITRTEGVFSDRTVLILDPRTGETLGTRYLMVVPGGETVYGALAVVERGVADEAGGEPVRGRPA